MDMHNITLNEEKFAFVQIGDAEGQILFDDEYIPPEQAVDILNYQQNKIIKCSDKLKQRAFELDRRVTETGKVREENRKLKDKLNYYEHKFASFNQEKENLVSEIKNRIKDLQQTEFKYMETERLISIMELKWMLNLISSGSCEVYETKKTIDEIK